MPVARDNCGTRDSEDEQFIDVCLGPIVFDAVRAVHPTTPILILGGHSHIRDCRKSRLVRMLALSHAYPSPIRRTVNRPREWPVHGNCR